MERNNEVASNESKNRGVTGWFPSGVEAWIEGFDVVGNDGLRGLVAVGTKKVGSSSGGPPPYR